MVEAVSPKPSTLVSERQDSLTSPVPAASESTSEDVVHTAQLSPVTASTMASGSPKNAVDDAAGAGVEKREAAGVLGPRARGQLWQDAESLGGGHSSPRSTQASGHTAEASPAEAATAAGSTSPVACADEAPVLAASRSDPGGRQEEASGTTSNPSVGDRGVAGAGETLRDVVSNEEPADPFSLPRGDTKDDDVVEMLPTLHASSQASLLSAPTEVDGQAGRSGSRTSKLTAGDLLTLRNLAVEAAGDPTAKASSPRMPGSGPTGISGPVKAPNPNSEEGGASQRVPEVFQRESSEANIDVLDAVHHRVIQQWASHPTPLKVPSEDSSDPIPEMHSSNNTEMHPASGSSMLFRQYQPLQNVNQRSVLHRSGNQLVRREEVPLREALRTHGAGSAPTTVGFLEAGPFWTCGSTPHCRASSRRATSNSSAGQTMLGDIFRRSASAADLSSTISSVLCNCINLVSRAVDVPPEPEPPEDELTTVFLETKEQRLQWRDFLSEAVSKCKANTLFQAYDVDADPPRYMRPPPSMAPTKIDSAVRSFRQAGMQTPPHIIAPRGAGWSRSPPKDVPVSGACDTKGSDTAASSSSPTDNGSFPFGSRSDFRPALAAVVGDRDLPSSIAPTPGATPAPERPGENTAANLGPPCEAKPSASGKLTSLVPPRTESLHSADEASSASSTNRPADGAQRQSPPSSPVEKPGQEATSTASPASSTVSPRSMSLFKLPSKVAVVSTLSGRRPPPAG